MLDFLFLAFYYRHPPSPPQRGGSSTSGFNLTLSLLSERTFQTVPGGLPGLLPLSGKPLVNGAGGPLAPAYLGDFMSGECNCQEGE